MTREFSIDGEKVVVVDDLLDKIAIKTFNRTLLLTSFSFLGATSKRSTFDEVMASFEPGDFSKTCVGQTAMALVQHEHPLQQQVNLYEVLCNSSKFGDVSFAHADHHDPAHLSVLYFANYRWRRDWEGELIFFDRLNEPIRAVNVKPGRFVVFPCRLRHRAGIPSRITSEPRLTVSMRFGPLQAANTP